MNADAEPDDGSAAGAQPAGHFAPLVVAIVAFVVVFDQATKAWAAAALDDGPRNVVGTTVQLALVRNSGGAFSRFQGMTPVLASLAIVIALVLVRAVRRATDRWTVVGLAFVLGGALGNLSDRLTRSPGFLRGEVVDFVKVSWWPVFNAADSAITIGAIVLVVRSLFEIAPTQHPHDA